MNSVSKVGVAMTGHIRRFKGDGRFVIVEGVPTSLAIAMAASWDSDLPPLRIAAGAEENNIPGALRLEDTSGTQLRNESADGVCLVLCEGVTLPDWQSISKFKTVSPSDLVSSVEDISILLGGTSDLDSSAIKLQIRQGILSAQPIDRPTAFDIAAFAEAVDGGLQALDALPSLRVFRDKGSATDFQMPRFLSNLQLASSARRLRATDLGRIRRAATSLFLSDRTERSADRLVELLDKGDKEVYSYVTYDEARQIIDGQSVGLGTAVRTQLEAFRTTIERSAHGAAPEIPWEDYFDAVRQLGTKVDQAAAARKLIDFDSAEAHLVFASGTRRKLSALLKAKSAVAIRSSSAAGGLVEAIARLRSPLTRINLIGSDGIDEDDLGRTNAQRAVSRAAFALHCADVFSRCTAFGVAVDQSLRSSPSTWLSALKDTSAEELVNLALPLRSDLPPISIRVEGAEKGDTVEYQWRPSLDDVILVRSLIAFGESSPAIALSMSSCEGIAFSAGRKIARLAAQTSIGLSASMMLKEFSVGALDAGLTERVLSRAVSSFTVAISQLRG